MKLRYTKRWISFLVLLAGCGGESEGDRALVAALKADQPFVAVYRDRTQAIAHAPKGMLDPSGQSFYLAVSKKALSERWFLSAYVKQFVPGIVVQSLGMRVVSFRVGNGSLYAFNADGRHKASDLFDPEILVEAYPLVDGFTSFEKIAASRNYVLIDPAGSLNRFSIERDSTTFGAAIPSRFMVELAFAQRFRRIDDGVTFEKVFTGYAERAFLPADPVSPAANFRASGVLGVALRRYQESEGFTPTKPPRTTHYFIAEPKLVPNAGTTEAFVTRWHVQSGMKPIRILVTDTAGLQMDPRFVGYDLHQAVKTGIEGWNAAFGFPVFAAEKAAPTDALTEDDKNFFVFDQDPAARAAFANIRYNPSTGEIRGASVYFPSAWVEVAHKLFADGAATVTPPMDMPGAMPARLIWEPLRAEALCNLGVPEAATVSLEPADVATAEALKGLTTRQKVERFVAHVAAHEMGHVLGLRHNFKGSLKAPSSSVMDYLDYLESAVAPVPGSYDTAAIQFLYGLTTGTPADPFCTDSQVGTDPTCALRDATSDPLRMFHGPRYTAAADAFLARADISATSGMVTGFVNLLAFARRGANAQTRLESWRTMMAPLRAPVAREKLATAGHGSRVETIAGILFPQIYPDPTPGSTARPPGLPADAGLLAEAAADLRGVLLNLDGIRSYASRRMTVDLLKKMQAIEGYKALNDARNQLLDARGTATGDDLVLLGDLIERVSRAMSPYFDR